MITDDYFACFMLCGLGIMFVAILWLSETRLRDAAALCDMAKHFGNPWYVNVRVFVCVLLFNHSFKFWVDDKTTATGRDAT